MPGNAVRTRHTLTVLAMPLDAVGEQKPGNAAVEEINEEEGDESHAVELGKVNAFARLWYFRDSMVSARSWPQASLIGSGLRAKARIGL